jgi:tRNA(Arg) A34 adenosine deaminase TadA
MSKIPDRSGRGNANVSVWRSSNASPVFTHEDVIAMKHAIALSREGIRSGAGGPFGAVVVRAGTPIGTGYNRVLHDVDPTAHAEVVAIRAACSAIGSYALKDCTLYASCRPCPMCLGAALWARIPLCWYANTSEDAKRIGFDDSLFYEQFDVRTDGGLIQVLRVPIPELIEAASRVFDESLTLPGFCLY